MHRVLPILLIGLWACTPPPSVGSATNDLAVAINFSDAGPARLGVEIYRDATTNLPDVLPLTENGACRTGRTAGTVCAPNGSTIAGAHIYAETRTCRGEPKVVETTANISGYFVLEDLAPGPVNVTITSGTFVGRFAVDIVGGQEVPLSNEGSTKVCLPADNAKLAVLTGDYDNIGAIIEDLGFEHDIYCGSWAYDRPAHNLLADTALLNTYSILFINCASGIDFRATNPEMVQIKENIRDYVRNGGSIYVSDLAVDWVGQLWPDKIQFLTSSPREREQPACCVCTTDCDPSCFVDPPTAPSYDCDLPNDLPLECREPVGPSGRGGLGEFTGQIVSPFLQQFVEATDFPISFDAGGWVQIESVAEDVEVLVNAQARPMMILFEPYPGGGRVAYTSFHNHVQATESMLQILRALVFRL
jgi:hypothetical protein